MKMISIHDKIQKIGTKDCYFSINLVHEQKELEVAKLFVKPEANDPELFFVINAVWPVTVIKHIVEFVTSNYQNKIITLNGVDYNYFFIAEVKDCEDKTLITFLDGSTIETQTTQSEIRKFWDSRGVKYEERNNNTEEDQK